MRDYSEFIQLIVEKSKIKKPDLIERDVILHTILKRMYSSRYFAQIFGPKRLTAKALLSGVPLSRNDRLYFYDFLEDYSEVEVLAYDLREILAEKVRAILTRKVQKLRDFYDLYLLHNHGLNVPDYEDAIIKKVVPALRYERYLENFERNKAAFDEGFNILDEYELYLLNTKVDDRFVRFFDSLVDDIGRIIDKIEET